MGRHRMAANDAAWLHMDRPVNRMIVTSVMWFDEALDADAVEALFADRLVAKYPRFTQRVVETASGVWWEDDPNFDLAHHLRRAALPAPGDVPTLHRFTGELASEPLPRDLPLWQAHVVAGFRGRGSAIVMRVHHCIADGVALSRVLLSLTDDPEAAAGAGVHSAAAVRSSRWPALGRAAGTAAADVRHPSRAMRTARDVAAAAQTAARVVALPPDARTCLRGEVGSSKTVAWSEPIPLHRMRAAAHAAHATVNDLALCAVSGALRNHLAREDGHARDIRVVVPVNLRPPDAPLPAELGNDFGLVFLQLPVSVDDAGQRLQVVAERTAALKRSPEAIVVFRLLQLAGRTPYQAEQLIVDLFTPKASGVVTNVVGPSRPVYLAGRRLRGMIGWPPESGGLALGVSVTSYDGDVVIGLLTDDRRIAHAHRLLEDLEAGIDGLLTSPGPRRAVAGSG